MKLSVLKAIIDAQLEHGDLEVVIEIQQPGAVGTTPHTDIEIVYAGFDWDTGLFIIVPSEKLKKN